MKSQYQLMLDFVGNAVLDIRAGKYRRVDRDFPSLSLHVTVYAVQDIVRVDIRDAAERMGLTPVRPLTPVAPGLLPVPANSNTPPWDN